MITALLLTLIAMLIVLYVVEHFGHESRARAARLDLEIALKYIADRREGAASQFAWLYLTRNDLRMRHNFPDFEAYRRRIETEEQEADHAGA
jgi:hypothetical protein